MAVVTPTAADSALPVSRVVEGKGTSARRWQAWSGWDEVRTADLVALLPDGWRLVVVAPHPDDEVLGAGGLMSLAARAGRPVLVLAVTDGDASHPGSTRWPRDRLVEQRASERAEALTVLGVDTGSVVRLGIADGQVPRLRVDLTRELIQHLSPSDVVISPWLLDGHPDHEAAARCVRIAARISGAQHLQVPIWGWHWSAPGDGWMPWAAALVLPLDAGVVNKKSRAVRCFRSQLEPDPSTGEREILPDWALDRLIRDREVFFRDPLPQAEGPP